MSSQSSNAQSYYGLNNSNTISAQEKQKVLNSWLFVADLPESTCSEDLFNIFKDYNVIYPNLIHGLEKTYAFVSFKDVVSAERARKELNGVKLMPKYASGKNKFAFPMRICKYEMKSMLREINPKCNLLIKNISKEFIEDKKNEIFNHEVYY